jgi:hypothetical protein
MPAGSAPRLAPGLEGIQQHSTMRSQGWNRYVSRARPTWSRCCLTSTPRSGDCSPRWNSAAASPGGRRSSSWYASWRYTRPPSRRSCTPRCACWWRAARRSPTRAWRRSARPRSCSRNSTSWVRRSTTSTSGWVCCARRSWTTPSIRSGRSSLGYGVPRAPPSWRRWACGPGGRGHGTDPPSSRGQLLGWQLGGCRRPPGPPVAARPRRSAARPAPNR